MTRFEIEEAIDAIVAASSEWRCVAEGWIGEPLLAVASEEIIVPGGFPADDAYRTFLTAANGLSVRTYDRRQVKPGHHVYVFEVVCADRMVASTLGFRAYADEMLRDGLDCSLSSYPQEVHRRILNESMYLGDSSLPTLLWSTGGAESGAYVVDYEYAGEPNFLKKIASSFDEYLERSLRSVLENEGLPVYY